jgi:hypothetical protein
MDTALATAEWQAFTAQYWGVEPVRLEYAPRGPGGPRLQSVFYADHKGRLLLPPYQPHAPLAFRPTPTEAPYRIQRQWLETARLLVQDMLRRGIRGEVTFPPALVDPRPWLWSQFRVAPRFTNFIDFPFELGMADRALRQHVERAARAGFVCRRTDRLDEAAACLAGSEGRQKFCYGITLAGLELAARLLGRDRLRAYVGYAPDGQPATARVILHQPGGRACDWMAGSRDQYLPSGVVPLVLAHVLEDLQQAGAAGYNSCGANIEGVAYAKTMWGGRLMPQYSILAYDFRPLKHLAGDMLRFWRRRTALLRQPATNGHATAAAPGRPAAPAPDGSSGGRPPARGFNGSSPAEALTTSGCIGNHEDHRSARP